MYIIYNVHRIGNDSSVRKLQVRLHWYLKAPNLWLQNYDNKNLTMIEVDHKTSSTQLAFLYSLVAALKLKPQFG